jgi:hypothetical protein
VGLGSSGHSMQYVRRETFLNEALKVEHGAVQSPDQLGTLVGGEHNSDLTNGWKQCS